MDFLWRGVDGGGGPTIISILAKHTEKIWVYCTLKQRGNHASFYYYFFFCTLHIYNLHLYLCKDSQWHNASPRALPCPSFNYNLKSHLLMPIQQFSINVLSLLVEACLGRRTYTDTRGQTYSGTQTFEHPGSNCPLTQTGKSRGSENVLHNASSYTVLLYLKHSKTEENKDRDIAYISRFTSH